MGAASQSANCPISDGSEVRMEGCSRQEGSQFRRRELRAFLPKSSLPVNSDPSEIGLRHFGWRRPSLTTDGDSHRWRLDGAVEPAECGSQVGNEKALEPAFAFSGDSFPPEKLQAAARSLSGLAVDARAGSQNKPAEGIARVMRRWIPTLVASVYVSFWDDTEAAPTLTLFAEMQAAAH